MDSTQLSGAYFTPYRLVQKLNHPIQTHQHPIVQDCSTATVGVDDALPVFHEDQKPHVEKNISVSEFALSLSDIVPNPWQAARIAEALIERLKTSGENDAKIYDRRSYLIPTLQEHVTNAVEAQAEQIFRKKLDSGRNPI